MFHRICKPSKSNSFFIFGARGVGKSSLLRERFSSTKDVLLIDLLQSKWEDPLLINPDYLIEVIHSQSPKPSWIVLDEVQKIPKLLDVVHYLIEKEGLKFALSGSSARKLKRGGANLLAGRAFRHELFPLTHVELKEKFSLLNYLTYGGLPQVINLAAESDKEEYLRSYVSTYLKEEIQSEQLVRRVKPFRLFLNVAAQMNAKILNYSKIANDIGVDTKTVQTYFQILQDTHVGVLIPAFHESLRKRQKVNPKFYYFDTGIARALQNRLTLKLLPRTYEFGDLFEQFIVLEMIRLNSYYSRDFEFSYLKTHTSQEVDVVIERPGLPTALVEIKSTDQIGEADYKTLVLLRRDYPKFEYYCLSNDPVETSREGVRCLTWQRGVQELGLRP